MSRLLSEEPRIARRGATIIAEPAELDRLTRDMLDSAFTGRNMSDQQNTKRCPVRLAPGTCNPDTV